MKPMEILFTAARLAIIVMGWLLFTINAGNAGIITQSNGTDNQESTRASSPKLSEHSYWHVLRRVMRQLDLTQAQRREIKAIMASERSTVEPLVLRLRQNRRELRSRTAGGAFDETEVRDLASNQAEIIQDLIVARYRVQSKVYAVLTVEQKAQADKIIDTVESLRDTFME